MNKSLKFLLAFILILVILNIIISIYGKYHNQSAIRKIGQVERRIDTAFRAIGRAEILIDSMLRRAEQSQRLLESIDMQVSNIRNRYDQDLKASRRNIEKLRQQAKQDQVQLRVLQEELKSMK
jgi:hypothetical protein